MNYIWETSKIIFSLGVVIALIFLLYYLLRDKLSLANKAKYMEVIDIMRLGSGEIIYLVDSFDKIIMIASGKEGSNKIDSWKKSDIDLNLDNLEEENNGFEKFKTDIFKDNFLRALNKDKTEMEKSISSDQDE